MEYETKTPNKESQESKDQDDEKTREQGVDLVSSRTTFSNVQNNHPESQIIGNVKSGVHYTPHIEVAPINLI